LKTRTGKTTEARRRAIHWISLAAVTALAALVTYRFLGAAGLPGWGLGAALGLGLCALSHGLWKRAQAAEGQAIVTAVMSAVVASFAILIGAIIAVRLLWPEMVKPAAFTALAIYLVHRFITAFQAGGPAKPAGGNGRRELLSTRLEERS
jgi:hypothetical protein